MLYINKNQLINIFNWKNKMRISKMISKFLNWYMNHYTNLKQI